MEHYFVKTNRHYWGQAMSLTEALTNAKVSPYSLLDACVEVIETEHASDQISEYLTETIDTYSPDSDGPIEAFIYIVDSERWDFASVDDVHGGPSYNWVGEGEQQDLDDNLVVLHVNIHTDGGITIIPAEEKG